MKLKLFLKICVLIILTYTYLQGVIFLHSNKIYLEGRLLFHTEEIKIPIFNKWFTLCMGEWVNSSPSLVTFLECQNSELSLLAKFNEVLLHKLLDKAMWCIPFFLIFSVFTQKQEMRVKNLLSCYWFELQFKTLYMWPLLQETFSGYFFGAFFNFRTIFLTIYNTEAYIHSKMLS